MGETANETLEPAADQAAIAALRAEYVASLGSLKVASDHVHAALDGGAAALVALRDHLEAGGRASDLAGILHPIPLRRSLGDSLHELERTRHRLQCMLFRLLHAEGMSMAEIGRTWGMSRQLVSRLIHEREFVTPQ